MKYIVKVGGDLVRGDMPDDIAKGIIARGKVTDSGNKECPVSVDGVYMFPEQESKQKDKQKDLKGGIR